MSFRNRLQQSWQQANLLTVALWPLSVLYRLVYTLRKAAHQVGILQSYRAPVPVIVIGNLTVGGTGKTPMVIYLVEQLRRLGYTPGVISRGYSGSAEVYPLKVQADTAPELCGDEPALIVRRTGVPMAVGPDRRADIKLLLQDATIDIIVSDDGLQHLALQRDIELCLVDETSLQSNPCLLPAGPYREPRSRLASVDLVVSHVAWGEQNNERLSMTLEPGTPVALKDESPARQFDTSAVIDAVAGIGNPQRFFTTCLAQGWNIVEHPFADHHAFSVADFDLPGAGPILMTEKDAVKCQKFATERLWYLPVNVKIGGDFVQQLTKLLAQIKNRQPG